MMRTVTLTYTNDMGETVRYSKELDLDDVGILINTLDELAEAYE